MYRIIMVLGAGIFLTGCAANSTSIQDEQGTAPQTILEKVWQWESTTNPMEKIEVADPENYTILLGTDGRAQIQIDCNMGNGEFKIAQGKLTFGPLLSTRMACPPGSLDSLFIRDLQRVVSFFAHDGRLYMELPYDSGTMKFRPEK